MKDLFSVVIPTLWRSERIHKLIKDLGECACVGEIIIIDNNKKFYDYYPSIFKGRIVGPEENLFVGPSWNFGVGLSKYENVVLCNDDINFDTKIFSRMLPRLDGFIGMSKENYIYNNFDEDVKLLSLTKDDVRPYGWGCLILFKKSFWLNIPENLKIWFTDDWIIRYNPAKKYVLQNFVISTDMSKTSSSDEFFVTRSEDSVFWDRLIGENIN